MSLHPTTEQALKDAALLRTCRELIEQAAADRYVVERIKDAAARTLAGSASRGVNVLNALAAKQYLKQAEYDDEQEIRRAAERARRQTSSRP